MRQSLWSLASVVAVAASPLAAAHQPPVVVSPGAPGHAASAARCPTFSWGSLAPSASGYELAVFAVGEDGALSPEPVLRQAVAAGASSWTPPNNRCLAAGRFAWSIRELGGEEPGSWADSRFFSVEDTSSAADLERAIERVLERYLAEGRLTGRAAADQVRNLPTGEPPAAPEPSPPTPTPGVDGETPSFIADTSLFDPPDCTALNQMFSDVPFGDSRCQFIQQFAIDQIANACGPDPDGGGSLKPPFCPNDPVTRGQLAVYLERAMRGTTAWDVDADLLDGHDSSSFARRDFNNAFFGLNTFNANTTFVTNTLFPGSGTWGGNGRVGIGTTSPDTPLDIHYTSGDVEFPWEGGIVPAIDVNTTGAFAGILRFRNALEIWPDSGTTRAGKLDVRKTDGSPTITLDGASGQVTANNLAALRTDYAGSVLIGQGGEDVNVLSMTVTAPAPGHLLVVTQVQVAPPVDGNHFYLLVSHDPNSSNVGRADFRGILGNHTTHATLTGEVATTGGQKTFVLKGTNSSGAEDARVEDATMTVLFVPNALAP